MKVDSAPLIAYIPLVGETYPAYFPPKGNNQ